jgi:hypothetical protein
MPHVEKTNNASRESCMQKGSAFVATGSVVAQRQQGQTPMQVEENQTK